jgi:predicted deacylase
MSIDNPAIELVAPNMGAYRDGGTGVDYVHTWDSGKPGRHVMISALTHGNEICGAIALDYLFGLNLRPPAGKLTFGFINTEAYSRFDPKTPYESRFVDEDFNRLWVEARLDSSEDTAELRRARLLRPLFDDVDDLLDIHSMTSGSPPLVLVNDLDKHVAMAERVGYPANVAAGPVFAPGKRIIEYTPFDDPDTDKTALLVECGHHWAKSTGEVARDTALRFLVTTGIMTQEAAIPHLHRKAAPNQSVLLVTDGITATTSQFRFVEDFVGCESFAKAGAPVAEDGDVTVKTPYDNCVLIMPNHRSHAGQRVARFARPR